jgi:hypothetical protein
MAEKLKTGVAAAPIVKAVNDLVDEVADAGGGPAATVDTLNGATTVGKAVMKATDQAAARSAIGAGTGNSSLAIGSTASTAAAGNHAHTATQVTATAVAGGTATNVQAILVELTTRVAALEAA